MKELVEVIAKALVDDPSGVVVTEKTEGKTTVIELHVSDADMGKVIGKQGRIAKAIRSVVKAAAAKKIRSSCRYRSVERYLFFKRIHWKQERSICRVEIRKHRQRKILWNNNFRSE